MVNGNNKHKKWARSLWYSYIRLILLFMFWSQMFDSEKYRLQKIYWVTVLFSWNAITIDTLCEYTRNRDNCRIFAIVLDDTVAKCNTKFLFYFINIFHHLLALTSCLYVCVEHSIPQYFRVRFKNPKLNFSLLCVCLPPFEQVYVCVHVHCNIFRISYSIKLFNDAPITFLKSKLQWNCKEMA